MAIRGGRNHRRSSEGDVALVQMQIAAQARNQRWHDFLCNKRDELQARLRQQGYSRDQDISARRFQPDLAAPEGAPLTRSSASSTRWGSTAPDAPEDDAVLEAAYLESGDSDDLAGDYEMDPEDNRDVVRRGDPSEDFPELTSATSPGAKSQT